VAVKCRSWKREELNVLSVCTTIKRISPTSHPGGTVEKGRKANRTSPASARMLLLRNRS